MTRRLVILPDVQRDLRVAMQWYEAESEGLALRFLDAANRQFDLSVPSQRFTRLLIAVRDSHQLIRILISSFTPSKPNT